MKAATPGASPALRIDKLLWFLRLAPSRTAAQVLADSGRVRLDGIRVERASHMVRVGAVITLPRGAQVLVVRLLAMPHRRGPAAEAMAAYERITPSGGDGRPESAPMDS